MQYTIDFSGSPQDVTITTFGPASRQGLVGFVQDLVDDPRYRPGMFILVDHLALDATTMTGDDVRAQAERVIKLEERLGPCKLAIVVPTALAAASSTRGTRGLPGSTGIGRRKNCPPDDPGPVRCRS